MSPNVSLYCGCLLTYSFHNSLHFFPGLWLLRNDGDFSHHNLSFSSIKSGSLLHKSYLTDFQLVNSITFFFNLSTLHSHHLFSMFLSYSSLVFNFNAGFPLGHVVKLHVWHCALMFSFSKHMLVNFLLYLCHPASHSQSHNLLQLTHLHLPSPSVSLNLAFSCAIFKANSSGFMLGQSVLYSLGAFHSHSLISFNIFLLYISSFCLI